MAALALALLAAVSAWGTSRLVARAARTTALRRLPDLPDTPRMPAALRQALAGADRTARQALSADAPVGPDEIGRMAGHLGRLYQANDYSERAARCYRLAIDFEPDNPRWPYNLAFLRQERGESEAVTGLLERTVELAPGYSPAWLKLADNQFKQGRHDAARRSYKRRLELSPGDPWAHLGLARLALAASDWEAAESHLRRAITTDSAFGAAHRLLASVHEHFGRRQLMQAELARADAANRFTPAPDPWVDSLFEQSFDVDWLLFNVSKYAYVGDGTLAEDIFNRARMLDPRNPEVYVVLGTNVQTLDEARRAFETAISLDPKNATAHALLGETLLKANKPRAAETVLRKALDLGARTLVTYRNLGLCLAMEGRFRPAIAYARRALVVAPENITSQYTLASILRRAGRTQEAVQQYRKLLQIKPSHTQAARDLAALLKRQGG